MCKRVKGFRGQMGIDRGLQGSNDREMSGEVRLRILGVEVFEGMSYRRLLPLTDCWNTLGD